MNFVLLKSVRVPKAEHRPLHHQRLDTCLAILQVPKTVPVKGGFRRGYCVYRASREVMWSWLECARANHRRLIRLHHPDRGGSHERAAILNAAWDRLQERLARKGIEYA